MRYFKRIATCALLVLYVAIRGYTCEECEEILRILQEEDW